MEKSNHGEALTADEAAYLERVKQAIRARQGGKQSGAKTKADPPAAPVDPKDWVSLIPLTDMTAPYKGEDGGLYGRGENTPPAAHARQLQADITAILQIARHHYPNLRVVYCSSRTFGGWSGRASGSPEPFAYESGFGTRWVVQSQINGDAQLNFDPARGAVKAPLVLWGPYLWAQGDTPRKIDGLTWTRNDVREDQLHPSPAGCRKTTALLLNFFKTTEGPRRWFVQP